VIKKKIVIVFGDPNSINSEIIYKTWKKLNNSIKKRICIVGNIDLIQKQFSILGYNLKLVELKKLNGKIDVKKLNIININLKFKNPFKVLKKESCKFIKDSLNLAHSFSEKKYIDGFINCPINKTILPKKSGVTEYLALKCNIKNDSEVMMIRNKYLSVIPLTTHININEVSKKIKTSLIKNKIFTFNNWFTHKYKKKPKIAMLGLNPHNSEFKKDSEEFKIIRPSINYLKKKGIKISGPFSADTIFIKEYKDYDVIVGMYHDQVLGPFKTLFKFNGINITLGLKYFRASPDHGVATNLIKKFKADPSSLLECVDYINNI
jgi:4-hydroxythreonine-4-phosphate dehydrogenase